MLVHSAKYKDGKCFKDHYAGFDKFEPINLIIGRNNSGKSRLIDFVEILCGEKLSPEHGLLGDFSSVFTAEALKRQFHVVEGGGLPGNNWEDHGELLVGKNVAWTVKRGVVSFEIDGYSTHVKKAIEDERKRRVQTTLSSAKPAFVGKTFKRLLADRDIQPEKASTSNTLDSNGDGATNIIRRYLRSTSEECSRELIQVNVLEALNEIFGNDGNFTEIHIGDHDKPFKQALKDHYEIYLGEQNKGLVALSNSGSGLKTVFLVLLNLIVIPDIDDGLPSNYVYAFEELENNLHPSLLRRLLAFITKYIVEHNSTLFLTTHSSTALDMLGPNLNAQIIHVEHDGNSSQTTTVSDYFSRAGVVTGLGARPSDILQANGILWLEGPSDRIYLNRWIQIFSNGELLEGQHYQCAFYGGSVLARAEFVAPDDGVDELVNLARINSNVVVVCDSDRTKAKAKLKPRVQRIQNEVSKMPNAFVWVTATKEIENYVLGNHLKEFCNIKTRVRNPKKYERFFPSKDEGSFMSDELARKTIDKVKLAIAVAPKMTPENMSGRFGLKKSIELIIDKIRTWNA